ALEQIAVSAARYCAAETAAVALREGETWRIVARAGDIDIEEGIMPFTGRYVHAKAMLQQRLIHTSDLQTSTEFPDGAEVARRLGFRAMAVAPMVRGDHAVGSIGLRRRSATPFTERQLDLLQAFAAHAAIAVENVRLFNETRAAVERQSACAAVLRAIAVHP